MNKTYKLTSIAMLTALSIVTNLFTVPLSGSNSVSFTLVICMFTGIYFGALPGAVVGFVGDLIAHLILPQGPYNWFIALATTLYGVICGLVYKMRLPKLAKLTIVAVICYVVCLCGLNTFGLWLNYIVGVKPSPLGLVDFVVMDKGEIKKSFWVYLAGRAPWSAINLVVNTVIVAGLQHSGVVEKLMKKVRNGDNIERSADEHNEQKSLPHENDDDGSN